MVRSKKAKPTNDITFFKCNKCGNNLNRSEAALSDTCASCLNPRKKEKEKPPPIEITADKSCFEIEKQRIKYMGVEITYIIWADKMFNPILEILNEHGVTIFFGNSAECDEGESIYNYLISKQIIKPQKDNEKRRW